MAVEVAFMKAGNLARVCELTDAEENIWLIEPYAVYTSSRGRRSLWYYQLDAPEGWKDPEVRFVRRVKMLEEKFTVRADYDPFDKNRFPIMHFSIPGKDGRQRWADKPKVDKTADFLRPYIE